MQALASKLLLIKRCHSIIFAFGAGEGIDVVKKCWEESFLGKVEQKKQTFQFFLK
jgi:hypothetical protein